jgi:lipoprotein-releasing system ATP-binding protein
VGSSGAGKTTLLQILGTLDSPSSGNLKINNTNPFELSSDGLSKFRNKEIGFIFQFHQLLPEFTAYENVMLPGLIRGDSKKEAKERAILLLEKIGLKDRINHKPSELSGGEQQRAAVCRALFNQPKIIFGDEPSGNLDTKNSQELHELFFQLREEFNQTFVIVTHNKDLAKMADRTLTMMDGKFIR